MGKVHTQPTPIKMSLQEKHATILSPPKYLVEGTDPPPKNDEKSLKKLWYIKKKPLNINKKMKQGNRKQKQLSKLNVNQLYQKHRTK